MDILTGGIYVGGTYLFLHYTSPIRKSIKSFIRKQRRLKVEGLEECKISKVKYKKYGKDYIVQLPSGYSFQDVETFKLALENYYKAEIQIVNIPYTDKIKMEMIKKPVGELSYKKVLLSAYQLLCGYNNKGENIIVDMLVTAHLLITGLGGNGKTGMVRIMIKNILENNKADVMLLNGFDDDYKDLNIKHIKDHAEIQKYIKGLLDGEKLDRPLFLFFEELGKIDKTKEKELIDLCTKLLQYGRHNNVYVVGIIQTATKEELKFKNLFNARLSFRQIDESAYKVVLGYDIKEDLNKREFALFSDYKYRGRTYKLDF